MITVENRREKDHCILEIQHVGEEKDDTYLCRLYSHPPLIYSRMKAVAEAKLALDRWLASDITTDFQYFPQGHSSKLEEKTEA